MNTTEKRERFRKFSHFVAEKVGSPVVFALACLIILLWAATGPLFHYSDTWQLVINTATTIVTFLMVFLIQNTQNRDAKAIHLKLDELIRCVKGARNKLVGLEDLTDEELDLLQKEFAKIRARSSHLKTTVKAGISDGKHKVTSEKEVLEEPRSGAIKKT